ncbi:hypothetical protein [Haloferula rosea]|uniref:Uncharacterized protein n=1 Tax=Haloferula rosea TaxID=490093 RepID=A0A934VD26_9BACT|nr:hypothetical protein [Haloferula rosea]MBK1829068.1 hypothetical protein [Haloferula rosea]
MTVKHYLYLVGCVAVGAWIFKITDISGNFIEDGNQQQAIEESETVGSVAVRPSIKTEAKKLCGAIDSGDRIFLASFLEDWSNRSPGQRRALSRQLIELEDAPKFLGEWLDEHEPNTALKEAIIAALLIRKHADKDEALLPDLEINTDVGRLVFAEALFRNDDSILQIDGVLQVAPLELPDSTTIDAASTAIQIAHFEGKSVITMMTEASPEFRQLLELGLASYFENDRPLYAFGSEDDLREIFEVVDSRVEEAYFGSVVRMSEDVGAYIDERPWLSSSQLQVIADHWGKTAPETSSAWSARRGDVEMFKLSFRGFLVKDSMQATGWLKNAKLSDDLRNEAYRQTWKYLMAEGLEGEAEHFKVPELSE